MMTTYGFGKSRESHEFDAKLEEKIYKGFTYKFEILAPVKRRKNRIRSEHSPAFSDCLKDF